MLICVVITSAHNTVLIETYWNVNTYGAMSIGTMGFVLIETYWNVNMRKKRLMHLSIMY